MGICDEVVFKEVFGLHVNSIQRFLIAKGLNREEAGDVVQDAFLRLWNNCQKVNFEKAKSFLFTTASNLFIDLKRKAQTKVKHIDLVPKGDRVEDPQFILESKEYKDRLQEVIDGMPDLSREVFIMNRFNDMKYREIAEHLGISVKAVEKRMSKALKYLAEAKIFNKR